MSISRMGAISAFHKTLYVQECMRKLFYRIDANSDGRLDWDEFSLYMLLENQVWASAKEF